MFRKVLAGSVLAIALAGAPSQLEAAERETPKVAQGPILDWLSGIWTNLATWATGGTDGSCWVDPFGGCAHNEPLSPAAAEGASVDGSCYVDPSGCSHGG